MSRLVSNLGVALTTPFNKDLSINYIEYESHINFLINNNASFIVPCGTTGETATFTTDEHIKTIEIATKIVNKKIPVIAGIGSNNTQVVIDKINILKEKKIEVDGFLVVTPYYNKATQNGLFEHFKTIANSTELPIILYNVPSRTMLNIEPTTVYKLSQIKNIIGIKEANSSIDQMLKIKQLCSEDFLIFCGNDNQIVPSMASGACGVISVAGNIIPNQIHEMINLFNNNEYKKSLQKQLYLNDLINELFSEINPIPIKTALNLMGRNQGGFRLPLTELTDKNLENLKTIMKSYKLI